MSRSRSPRLLAGAAVAVHVCVLVLAAGSMDLSLAKGEPGKGTGTEHQGVEGAHDRTPPILGGGAPFLLPLPETGIRYRIEATLTPETRILKGREEIRWTNPTDQPVAVLPLHLYLNGFSHTQTTWMREAFVEEPDAQRLLEKETDPWGYIEPTAITQRALDSGLEGGNRRGTGGRGTGGRGTGGRGTGAGSAAKWAPIQPDDGNPLDRSLAAIELPFPVAPGAATELTIAFEAKLPIPIARTGGRDGFFLIGQWYPKIGVIEAAGVRHASKARVAARQFHATTEFYADFADYDVTLTVPAGWLVGATGRAVGEAAATTAHGSQAHRFRQRAVHDFALVAGRSLEDQWFRHAPQGGGPAVDVRYIVPAGTAHQIPRWRKAVEGSMDLLGSRVGPYPYDVLTAVMMPFWASQTAGMEYPTFITGAPGDPLWDRSLFRNLRIGELTLVHEFGHQYFYGLLASNEQEEAFLDEGFNSYWELEIMRAVYGPEFDTGTILGRGVSDLDVQLAPVRSASSRIHEPLRKTPSSLYASRTLGAQVYFRCSAILGTAANLFGRERLDRVFAEYFRRFAFHHPDLEDFLRTARDAGGADLERHLRESFDQERVPDFSVTRVDADPVGSSRVDLQACKLEYSIVSPK